MIEHSDGPDWSFALARFDGADTLATVRLEDTAAAGPLRLTPVPKGPPALILAPNTKDRRP